MTVAAHGFIFRNQAAVASYEAASKGPRVGAKMASSIWLEANPHDWKHDEHSNEAVDGDGNPVPNTAKPEPPLDRNKLSPEYLAACRITEERVTRNLPAPRTMPPPSTIPPHERFVQQPTPRLFKSFR